MTTTSTYTHDPDAVLDYEFDWSAWLEDAETIASHVLIPSDGITVDSHSESAGKVTAWLSGAQLGRQTVTCRITTNQGRTDDRTLTLNVRER